MRYVLLIYQDMAVADASPESMRAMVDEYRVYEEWLAAKGIKRAGEALYPTDQATTVRVREGGELMTDGPFAETREQLAGFYLLECDNLDDALEAARACPGSGHGSIEVRPVVDLSRFEGGS